MTGAALRFAEHRLGPAHRVGRITLARSSVRAHMSPSLYPSLWSQTATPEVDGERLIGTAPMLGTTKKGSVKRCPGTTFRSEANWLTSCRLSDTGS